MAPRIMWVDAALPVGGIALVTRPRASPYLDEDCRAYAAAGLTGIVSLMEAHEADLVGLSEQGQWCAAAGLSFHSVPVEDHGLPADRAAFTADVAQLSAMIEGGARLGFHCFATLGRSPLLAACVLVRLGMPGETALERLSAARKVNVPETTAQREWVLSFGK